MLDTAKVPYLNRLVTSGQRKDVCQMLQQIYRCYIKNQGDLHDKGHAIGMDAMGDLSCDRRNAWTKVVQISWRWREVPQNRSSSETTRPCLPLSHEGHPESDKGTKATGDCSAAGQRCQPRASNLCFDRHHRIPPPPPVHQSTDDFPTAPRRP